MKLQLKSYVTPNGDELLYCGNPNFEILNNLAKGTGDVWHSSFIQGYKNAFPELIYQTSLFWWYLNDFENVEQGVSWRINPNAFVVRASVWNLLGGFEMIYDSKSMAAFSFGINLIRNHGGVPLHVENLFTDNSQTYIPPNTLDRYKYFRRHFKARHSLYMLFRQKGRYFLSEYKLFQKAKKELTQKTDYTLIPVRSLSSITGNPTVSVVIPTMFRQEYTCQLIQDYKAQSYNIKEIIVVDATPKSDRTNHYDSLKELPFKLTIKWQITSGSCRARNEAITLCSGDYIIFADDDIRIPPDFVENHIKLLQNYNANACNGLDIRAEHHTQNLEDLTRLQKNVNDFRSVSGASQSFSNANSCVAKSVVDQLVGNDINYDGGYGEDGDFGLSITKLGYTVLHNPLSINLHLKPPAGGYRWWNAQAKLLGKKRKMQPWELNHPVKGIVPRPSPTVMYQMVKHFPEHQLKEYKRKYFFLYLFNGSKLGLPWRIIKLPMRLKQFKKSVFYAKKLKNLGVRHS